MLEELTLEQLLERWRGDLVRAGLTTSDAPSPPQPEPVAALEQRIGRPLPPTYREFLTICDGLPVAGGFTAGLRSAASTGWFRDIEADWLQAWAEVGEPDDPPNPDVELMQRALLVSEPGDQALLLDPDDVDPATGEWACYTLSNFAAGTHRIGSFRDGLERVYLDFLANHDVDSITGTETEQFVERAYRSLLAGDLTVRARMEDVLPVSWRAWLLATQFDVFGARPYQGDKSTSVRLLWGGIGGVNGEEALTDPVLLEELVPVWVVRLVEASLNIDWELHRAPEIVATRMRTLMAQIADGTGPVADFSYSPGFAARIDLARAQIADGDIETAWDTVRAALPTWTPRTRNHLAPLGLYYDKDLRRLLTPPRPQPQPHGISVTGPAGDGPRVVIRTVVHHPAPPASPASVTALSKRKQHSDRTLLILTAPYLN